MVEESVDEQGVLIHGKEPYNFDRSFFEVEADDISKYILNKGVPKKSKRAKAIPIKEKDQYQQYSPSEKLNKIKKDIIKAFQEHQFQHKRIQIESSRRHYTTEEKIKLDVFENTKRKERFYALPYNELKNTSQVNEMNNIVRYFIFSNLSLKEKWKNIFFVIVHGNVTKQRINDYYEKLHHNEFRTTQNTTIGLDFPIIYHGLGQGNLSKGRRYWNFSSSLPKFFVYNVKSKDDIVGRIGLIEDFIEEHKNIFKNVSKLKSNQKQYQIIPKEIERQKQEKRRKIEEKKREIRKAKRWARPRRYSHRGIYTGNPAYIGTPKE